MDLEFNRLETQSRHPSRNLPLRLQRGILKQVLINKPLPRPRRTGARWRRLGISVENGLAHLRGGMAAGTGLRIKEATAMRATVKASRISCPKSAMPQHGTGKTRRALSVHGEEIRRCGFTR